MSWTRNELTGHEYDGISEYDNPTPSWWHLIFLASVVFSVFYFTYYINSIISALSAIDNDNCITYPFMW